MGLFGFFQRDEPSFQMVDGFPFEVAEVGGSVAVEKALRWRVEWRGSFWPVILGKGMDFLREGLEDAEGSVESMIEFANNIDVAQLFERRLKDSYSLEDEDDPLGYVTNPSGWEINPGMPEISSVKEVLSKKYFGSVTVAKIPTGNCFEIPAYLRVGGWNECPSAVEQVAVWKHWQAKYGAEILCVTGDVIEATVQRPPVEKEDCYALAREQFAFCNDIVDQGVESIDALAATLRKSPYWYFWWD